LLIRPQEARSPDWWQKQKPDAVLLGLWTMPKYDAIRTAALSATPRVLERCDSDGIRLPSSGHALFFKNQLVAAYDRAAPGRKLLFILGAAGKCLAHELTAPWMSRRVAQTLRRLPFFLAETPMATSRFQALAKRWGIGPEKFRHIPHPIDTSLFRLPSSLPPKRPLIVSVGRWQALQKDWPLLESSLRIFLERRQNFSATIFGPGAPAFPSHQRIVVEGSSSPEKIAACLQESQMLFFASRYESFLLAGAEALCCGCSVVGPREVVSSGYFTSFSGGAPPARRKAQALADALVAEADQWQGHHRDPLDISTRAVGHFSYLHVARAILGVFEEI
jgi:glycosyltransferase involved in cell wall biosynthesis